MAGIVPLTACGVKRKGYKVLWCGCRRIDDRRTRPLTRERRATGTGRRAQVGRISRVHFLRIRGSDGCAAQILRGRAADGEKMPTTTRFDLGGGGLPSMP